MKRAGQANAWTYAPLAALAGAAALVTGLVLVGLATPQNFNHRLAALDQRTGQLRRWTAVRPGAARFPQGAICAAIPKAEDLLRGAVTAQAKAGQLTLSALEVGVDPDSPLGETLVPLRVRFQVQGSYQSLLELMDRLSESRPLLFVDTADLISNTSSVTLKVSGRAYCSA